MEQARLNSIRREVKYGIIISVGALGLYLGFLIGSFFMMPLIIVGSVITFIIFYF